MLVYSDYLHKSKMIIYNFKENNNLNEICLEHDNLISYGKLIFNNKNKDNTKYIINDTYLFILNGRYYSTNIPISILLFRKNISTLCNINIFTTITSTILFENKNNIINNLYKEKIGFDTDTYNFYKKDYYYDYYFNKNNYALICIKISAIVIFIWNIVYLLLIKNNINLDFLLYTTFYKFIYDNLNSENVFLSNNINTYFTKYCNNLVPQIYDEIIINWTNLINNEDDLIKILIYQQSSIILKFDELLLQNTDKLFKILNYNETKNRFEHIINKIYNEESIIKYNTLNIINKNEDFLNNWKVLHNKGVRNNGLYVRKDKVLLKRDSTLISKSKIEMYINLNNRYDYFPKLFNIYNINNFYYYESEKLDYDLFQLFSDVFAQNAIKDLSYSDLDIKNKLINIFLFKFNKKSKFQFDEIEQLISFFKENEVDIDIYENFIEKIYLYFCDNFITIIKNIALLEYKLYKINYFVSDYHKFENFGYKIVNGTNKYYIIDWEYLIHFNDNLDDKKMYLEKIIQICNTRTINDNCYLSSSVLSNLESELDLDNIDKNILKLMQYEKIFIDNTPLICHKIKHYDNRLNETIKFIYS